jgi:heat shock protein HslJ
MLMSLNGDELVAGSTITLDFEGGAFRGSGGCNGYGGTYTAGDGKITRNFFGITANGMRAL